MTLRRQCENNELNQHIGSDVRSQCDKLSNGNNVTQQRSSNLSKNKANQIPGASMSAPVKTEPSEANGMNVTPQGRSDLSKSKDNQELGDQMSVRVKIEASEANGKIQTQQRDSALSKKRTNARVHFGHDMAVNSKNITEIEEHGVQMSARVNIEASEEIGKNPTPQCISTRSKSMANKELGVSTNAGVKIEPNEPKGMNVTPQRGDRYSDEPNLNTDTPKCLYSEENKNQVPKRRLRSYVKKFGEDIYESICDTFSLEHKSLNTYLTDYGGSKNFGGNERSVHNIFTLVSFINWHYHF